MILNKTIFRAYDIRWIYWKDFDLEWAEQIGKWYWTILINKNKNKKNLKIVVWRDWRTHSEEIQKAFIKWVQSTWIEITNIWLSPSPLLYFSICKWEFDWWVNITASHNPKEYNWFKLQWTNSTSIFGDEIQELYNLCKNNNFIVWKIKEEKFWSYFVDYMNKIKSITWNKKNNKNKIVIDAWNGVAWPFSVLLLKYLWYEVIELYCNIDGTFPNHQADPEQENTLEDLKNKVKSEWANLWIAFDWDWDRLWIVDNEWINYNADKLLILFARDLLAKKPNSTVVYELNVTSLLKEEVEKLWWKAIMSKTWHSYVEHSMKENKALLAWENSWHLFFADNYYWFDDALLASAIACKILLRDNNIKIKDHFSNLSKTFEYTEKWTVKEENKFKIIENISKNLGKKYKINHLDWIRVEFENHWWLVLRASNTSPKIQLKIESRSKEQLNEIKKIILKTIKDELDKN